MSESMLRYFNLLITTSRRNEKYACFELLSLLQEIGIADPVIDKTGVSGLIVAKTALNPFMVIEKLRDILDMRPYKFRYILRVIPIEKVVPTNLNEIYQAAVECSPKIEQKETFRITVEKRHTKISRYDLINAVATNIERTVDLNTPNKIILIEIMGGLTGLSVIKPTDILAVMKEKRR